MSWFDRVHYALVKIFFSPISGVRNNTYFFIRFLSKLSYKTFPVAVFLSRIYIKTNNRFSAEEIIRLYSAYEEIKLSTAKELFKLGSYYKVVRIFSSIDNIDIDKKYGVAAVELLGDAYFSLRRFKEALVCYEYIISRVAGAKLSRIKSAECYFHMSDYSRSQFRLDQYKNRFGVNSRTEMLEKRLNMNKVFKKDHKFNDYLNLKYGVKMNYKVKIC